MCSSAIDCFYAADIILHYYRFISHPFCHCSSGEAAQAFLVYMRDLFIFAFYDQNRDINAQHCGYIHRCYLYKITHRCGFKQAQHSVMDSLLVVHVRARVFHQFAGSVDNLFFIGFEFVNQVTLEICNTSFLRPLFGGQEVFDNVRVFSDEV